MVIKAVRSILSKCRLQELKCGRACVFLYVCVREYACGWVHVLLKSEKHNRGEGERGKKQQLNSLASRKAGQFEKNSSNLEPVRISFQCRLS